MRVDLVVPNEGPFAVEAVRGCRYFEEMEFDSLWFTDHVVGFEKFRPVYGPRWLDVLAVLAHAAATTDRIRIGSSVLVLPYRDAVYAAKSLATIDVLSGGRLDLGVGTGWSRSEFFALGRGDIYHSRGAYTDEALDVMKLCWQADGAFDYQGRFFKFRKVEFEPKPIQRPIPLWVGARTTGPVALRRAAQHADVWHPSSVMPPTEIREAMERVNNFAGRSIPTGVRVKVPDGVSRAQITGLLQEYKDAGCYAAVVDLRAESFRAFVSQAEELASAVDDIRG